MPDGADVASIEALRDWLAALAVYRDEVGGALAGVQIEIRRGLEWVSEQLALWQRAVRDCEEEVTQRKTELAAKKFPTWDGRMPDTTVEERNLRRALARLEHAEEQVRKCRSWTARRSGPKNAGTNSRPSVATAAMQPRERTTAPVISTPRPSSPVTRMPVTILPMVCPPPTVKPVRYRKAITSRNAAIGTGRITWRSSTVGVSPARRTVSHTTARSIASSKILLRSVFQVLSPVGQRISANVVLPVFALMDPATPKPDPKPREPGLQMCCVYVDPQGRLLESWFHYPASLAIATRSVR